MTEAPSGYERQDLEKYFTPAWVTEALLSVQSFAAPVWDPAAGAGHISDVFSKRDGRCWATDISPDADHVQAMDFLTARMGESAINAIVTNPPFGAGGKLAVQFIDHALDLMRGQIGGKVAMLLRVDFDSAGGRRRLFADHPAFARKIVLTTRIRWANLPQSAAGPTQNHAWFVWDWSKDPNALPVVNYAGQPRAAA